MPRSRTWKPILFEVTGLSSLPPAMEEWERTQIEPLLARLFDVPNSTTNNPKELRDGKESN